MNCRECQEKLSLYLDGQLTDEECRRLEEALERCPDCARDLASLKDMVTTLRRVEPVEVPGDLLGQLKDSLRQEVAASPKGGAGQHPSLVGRLGRWRVAASFLALMFAVWVVYQDQMVRPGEEREGIQLADAVDHDEDSFVGGVALEDSDRQHDTVGEVIAEPTAGMSPAPGPVGAYKGAKKVANKSAKSRRARTLSGDRGGEPELEQGLAPGRGTVAGADRGHLAMGPGGDLDALRRAISDATGEDFQLEIAPLTPGLPKGDPLAEDKRPREIRARPAHPLRKSAVVPNTAKAKTGASSSVTPHEAYLLRSARGLRPVEEALAKLGIAGLRRQPIRSLEEKKRGRIQDSKSSREDLGILLTVTVTRAQEKALLKALSQDKATSLRLFARSGMENKRRAAVAKAGDSRKAPPPVVLVTPRPGSASPAGTAGRGSSPAASRPSPGQVRLSFVVLKQP